MGGGGVGVPHITKYYLATNISQTARLLSTSNCPLWHQLESAVCAPYSLRDLVWIPAKAQPRLTNPLTTTKLSLQLWLRWAPKMLSVKIETLAPLTSLQHHTHDLDLGEWVDRGLTQITHLYGANGLLAFPDLQSQYHLPNSEIFTYLRIKHILGATGKERTPTQPQNHFDLLCQGQKTPKKPLSLCYHRLLDIDRPAKQSYMLKWERELNCELEHGKWIGAMTLVKRATKCLDHVEAAYKMWMQWYYTPHRLAQIYPGVQNRCWRCSQQGGNTSHIFWYCPALSQYWQHIQDIIKSKLGKQLPLKPEHYLLHMLPRDFTAYEAVLTTHITLAAKTCIAALWKTMTVPDIKTVLAKISLTQQYEQMAHTIGGTLEHYNRTWSKW
ncbi:Hypothetical predicted protein [Pelobates cultripes]|uniref:Uncharacterized protein n=1 Tax=Pelobates cultripes TaxID=61616 RepID=A0AAD1S9N2_PELCU|nr:Hypothetical predicted protein [Pelobates cultripes]